jgi:8-oxo-dGTP pyrophosphatase MutT (NUDIX family)
MTSPIADRLRTSLAGRGNPELLVGDLDDQADTDQATPAAVLIAVTDARDPSVVLTVRREHLRTHAGQVAFPGGRIDPGEDAVGAALRESHEELLLDPAAVEVIGTLDPYATVTGYRITPVIGVIAPGPDLTPHQDEVADWFEAPLAHLLDPANQQRRAALFAGRERHYYEIMWGNRRIWGATAAIIVNLSRRLQSW